MGDWQPYGKLKPYIQFKIFLLLWLPTAGYLIYGATIGDFWDLRPEDAAFGIPVMIGIIAFPFYHILAPLYMNQLVFRQPPWLDLHCPECGDRDKPIAELMCWDRLSGPFPCKGCDRLFALESLAQPDWPFDDSSSQSRKALAKAPGPVIHIKPKVPFRLGPFVWRQNNPNFTSHHWELVKVIPALLILYGLKHFSVLPGWVNWDLVFMIVFVYLSIDLFILRNRWFSETFSLPFEKWWQKEVSQYVPKWMKGVPGIWWQDQAIWLILAVLGILFFLLLGPEAFGIMSG
tara:strand:- start:2393 stop:3259 length:867 start_codon:yes stop_codon:yes gene_type:complete